MKSIQWNSSMRFFTKKILAQCLLFSFLRHKKKIIHIRLTNQPGYYHKLNGDSQIDFDKLNDIPTGNSHKFVPTETKKKFSGKSSKTKQIWLKNAFPQQKVRLDLTNQQTNEHLNKNKKDWFRNF